VSSIACANSFFSLAFSLPTPSEACLEISSESYCRSAEEWRGQRNLNDDHRAKSPTGIDLEARNLQGFITPFRAVFTSVHG
jgi:hypothetical protein